MQQFYSFVRKLCSLLRGEESTNEFLVFDEILLKTGNSYRAAP